MKTTSNNNTKTARQHKTFGASISEHLKAKNEGLYRKIVSDFAVSTRGHK